MDSAWALLIYPFPLRLVAFFSLITLTYLLFQRGIQYSMLLGLACGMNRFVLLRRDELPLLDILPHITLDRTVWPIIFLMFFWKLWRGEYAKPSLDWIEYSMLGLISVILLSLVTIGHYGSGSTWNLTSLIQGYLIPYGAYITARRAIKTNVQFNTFLIGLGFIALYIVFTGWMQVLQLDAFVFPKVILDSRMGIHFGLGRPRGIFLNASLNGLAIAMAFPIFIWLCYTDRGIRWWLWSALILLSFVPLAYVIQRAAWLSAGGAMIVTAIAWPGRRVLFTGLLVGAVIISLYSAPADLQRKMERKIHDDHTVDFRYVVLKRGLLMFSQQPLKGVGFNRFSDALPNYTSADVNWSRNKYPAHNTPLTVLAELGILGFIPFLGIFVFFHMKTLRLYLKRPEFRGLIAVVWGVTAAFILMMLSIEMRDALYANTCLSILWAASLTIMERQLARQGGAEPYSLLR